MPRKNTAGWPTRQQAAETLKVHLHTLDRWITAGKLETAPGESRDGKKPPVLINPADVDRLKPPEPSVPAFLEPSNMALLAATDPLEKLAQLSRMYIPRWLTLAEASEQTGLGERTLRRFIRDGLLPAVRDRRRWMIHPDSLRRLPEAISAPSTH